MSIERLKQLLDEGLITQAEFDEMAKNIKDPDPAADPEPVADPEPTTDPEPKKEPEDVTKSRTFQKELDKKMAAERKKNAELQRKVERMEKKILSDEELKQEEYERQQQEIEEQRREIKIEKNKMYAVKSMQKAEIGNSEEAMSLMEKLVMVCEDETEIDDMIELLKAWKDKDVKAEVDKRFKDNGYTPKKGADINNVVNPFKAETFNLTEQIRLKNDNPELAAKFMAAAGVK